MSSVEDNLEIYAELGRSGSIEPRIGRSLISIVDAVAGRAAEYNRWYEDEHMIVSALACPWVFSGRRFVATRDLRALRSPPDSRLLDSLDRGAFLNIYWILDGHYDQFLAWVRSQVEHRLYPEGRMPKLREHVFTNDQQYLGAAYRDQDGPRDIHALIYPFRCVVVQVIEANSTEHCEQLYRSIIDRIAPRHLSGATWSMCLAFLASAPPIRKSGVEWYGKRITLLWFGEEAPDEMAMQFFDTVSKEVDASGQGRVELVAPFEPVLPGSNAHIQKL